MSVVQSLYEDATIVVRVNSHDCKAFGVRIDVYQGPVLNPLLFVMELEALSQEFCEAPTNETDVRWWFSFDGRRRGATGGEDSEMETSMEKKVLIVNLGKTKVVKYEARFGDQRKT